MTNPEIIAICAIVAGPLSSMFVSLQINKRRERKKQKMDLFLTLLAQRKRAKMNEKILDALNTIDVIFYGESKILDAKQNLWESNSQTLFDIKLYDMRYLKLLDEMSKHLGYKEIKQVNHDSPFIDPNEVNNMTTEK